MHKPIVAIIGGGPAGLMAAEALTRESHLNSWSLHLYEAKPSVGRKFLIAGKGGLNLTHSEPLDPFLSRYGNRRPQIEPLLRDFGPQALRDWAAELGIPTFIGSSGRVFPREMKAAPLLRTWLHRLRQDGVQFHVRHRWQGWQTDGALLFATPHGQRSIQPDAVILALGGGSWPQLGSDGAWVPLLMEKGVAVVPLKPTNCGFDVAWSDFFLDRFAGEPLKSVGLRFTDSLGVTFERQGACVVSQAGLEGSLIYAASAQLRDEITRRGHATIHLDLAPDRSLESLQAKLAQPRGSRSMANHLKSKVNIQGVLSGLLYEIVPKDTFTEPANLAAAIKALPVRLLSPRPIEEAISSAGGIPFEALDERLMVRTHPGLFCAGEMLDWEAPTGGYLLTACFASGRAAGLGVAEWMRR